MAGGHIASQGKSGAIKLERLFSRFPWRSIWRLNWAAGEDVAIGRLLACGAFVWGAYSIVQIAINGVVMDEVLAPAQIISGAVQFPAGHPHQIYYPTAYNLFHYLAAGVWAIDPSPLAISAARNFLFLFVSAFTPFAIAVLLARRPLWGHLAAAATVTEMALRFEGVYPMWIFPNGYSNGHIGLHAAMLVAVLLLARQWKTGGLLLGMLPAIHPAMPLVIWPWSGAYLLFSRESLNRRERTGLLLAIGSGLVVCAALALIIFIRAGDSGAVPPYDIQSAAQVDGKLVHWQFTTTTDAHRRLAPLWYYGYSVSPIALLAILALLLWNPKRSELPDSAVTSHRIGRWLLALSVIAAMYVYGAWVIQYWRGWLPGPIAISMPFRFSNVLAVLLVPVTVAAVACAYAVMGERPRQLALLILACLIFIAGTGFFSKRYPEALYAVWGTLLAMDFYACRRRPWRRWAPLAAILTIVAITLAISGETRIRGAWIPLTKSLLISFMVCLLAFGLSGLHWRRRESRQEGKPVEPQEALQPAARSWLLKIRWGQVSLLCACVAASLLVLPRSPNGTVLERLPRWDMISQDDRDLSQWLATHARPNEMILPAITPTNKVQHMTNHPALMEKETLWLMSYMPNLSPVIGIMMRDLYGIDYTNLDQFYGLFPGGRVDWYSPVLQKIWKERKRDEWQALGRKYGFRLALSPTDTPLDLPVALRGRNWDLYEIR